MYSPGLVGWDGVNGGIHESGSVGSHPTDATSAFLEPVSTATLEKGETSGHELLLKEVFLDCDQDTVLIKAQPIGPTCHTGARSCFFTPMSSISVPSGTSWGGITQRLFEMVSDRKAHPSSDSYVSTLLQGDVDRILKKVVEEAGEVVLAGKNDNRDEIIYEMADLWFHTLVMLGYYAIPPEAIYQELGKRFGKSGIRTVDAETSHG